MTTKPNTAAMPLCEPAVVDDRFAATLARIETIGPVSRLIFAVPQSILAGASVGAELVVVARLIVPTDALPHIARQLAHANPVPVGVAEDGAEAEDRPARFN